jgi:Lipase (class 3)
MVPFKREDSKKLYLPLALRAYDTTLNESEWKAIGYNPVGQISIDHHALMTALAEEQKALEKRGEAPPEGGDNLEDFVKSVERDMTKSGDFFGWVALNEDTATVAVTFRGTEDFDEWLKDVFVAPVPYSYGGDAFGLVHAGFLIMYKSVRKSATDLLKSVPNSKYGKFVIGGHSLGAAVATLSAPDLFQAISQSAAPEVRTFASPRPADLIYSKTITGLGISVMTHRNRYDIVPTVPYPPYFHTDTVALIGGGEFLHPKISHSLRQSYHPGLEALISDESKLGGQPEYPYIYSEVP